MHSVSTTYKYLIPVVQKSQYKPPLFIALKSTPEINVSLFSEHLPLHNLLMHVFPVLLVTITSQVWVDVTQTYTSYIYSRPHGNYQNQNKLERTSLINKCFKSVILHNLEIKQVSLT
jgi:hypothetical protein